MPVFSSPRRAPSDHRPATLGETGRAVATVALVFVLSGLALAVAGNTVSGASALVRTIKGRLYSPLTVPAWLDLGFDYHLTYGLPEDARHGIELTPHAGGPTVRLPDAAVRGERAARWRRLARAIGGDTIDAAEGSGDRAELLAAAVAAGGFARLAAEDVELRVVRTLPPERAAVGPPRVERPFAARVRRVDGGLQLIKAEPPETVAPLVGRRPGAPVSAEGAVP